MKNSFFVSIVVFWCGFLSLHAEEKNNLAKQYEFQRLTLQRSWHYASLLVDVGSPEVQREHARTMATAAFHYWVMKKSNLIEEMPIYEAQVRKTFKDKKLDPELLNDPLCRFSANTPRYSLPNFNMSDEDYKKLADEFKEFFLEGISK